MKFEIGRYYQNLQTGDVMHILCRANTFFYGDTLIAETVSGSLKPVGLGESSVAGWQQVSGWPRADYAKKGIPGPPPSRTSPINSTTPMDFYG